uniref:Uncharacterized protein n=1 Tax=Clastoptera arizonana TaxID=38151 RepID=A0A1B6DIQ5_9HEMI
MDSLDLTGFAQDALSVDVYLSTNVGDIVYGRPLLRVGKMEKVFGRKAKSERIFGACDTELLDGQGANENNWDIIVINGDCSYRMQIIIRPNTNVYNDARRGEFNYTVLAEKGKAKINISNVLSGRPNSRHNFFFNYTISELVGINIQNTSQTGNYTFKSATFSFLPNVNTTEDAFGSTEEVFNVTISDIPVNASYIVSSGAEIKIGNKGNLYMLESADKEVDEIIRDYLPVANRLNKMSFFIQSLKSNETVVIGSGNYEVIYNNPVQKSHLVGNGGENVYVIVSKRFESLPEVIIHDLDTESSVDTIDLRNLTRATGEFSNGFKVQVLKSANDLLLKGTVQKVTKDSSFKKSRLENFTVRLKDGVSWYDKIHVVMNNVPLRIIFDRNEWNLKSQPLRFENDKEIILITSQDVEENTEVITPKRAGNYLFVRDHRNNPLITNAFDANITKKDLCTITLSGFYEELKMESLSIRFADSEIVLRDKRKEINSARDINVVKREHRKQAYSDLIYSSPEVMLSDQPRHKHNREVIRNRRIKTNVLDE